MNRFITFLAGYLGFALVALNLLGIDPTDIIFFAVAALILVLNPRTYTFPQVSLAGSIGITGFFLCYLISCLSGYRFSFVVYVLSGLAMSVVASFYVRVPGFRLGNALFVGFVVTNIVAVLLWTVGIWPQSVFFEMFRDGRYLGSMGDPNFTGLMAAFSLYFFIDRLLRPQKKRSATLINISASILLVAMLLFSQSRAAWAAALAGLAIQLIASRQLFTFRTAAAIFSLTVIVMVIATANLGGLSKDVGSVSDRLTTVFVQNDEAEEERFKFFYSRVSLEVGLEHPLGVGPGMTFTYTGLINTDGQPIGAHNAYVEIMTENGWLALGFMIALLTIAWFRLFQLASADVFLGDISCRTILAGLTATAMFGMGHDLLGWRIGWIFPILGVLAAFHIDYDTLRPLWTTRRRDTLG